MESILVTGAFGLVGKQTVARLAASGRHVVATDLETSANVRAARRLGRDIEVRWADLTLPGAADRLVGEVAPSAIIHLAAVIPPACYQRSDLARRVNVGATQALVAAAEQLASAPRFIQASSVAVYGSRNPRHEQLLTAETPISPSDSYGSTKREAEAIVRASSLPWLILRLGAVVSSDLRALPLNADTLFLEWALPIDGRVTTVDVRDVAAAFASAACSEVSGEVLLIGGDDTHRQLQGDVGPAIVSAIGLSGAYPVGRRGDPEDDRAWFVCDFMDTRRAQEVLGFQHHSWPHLLQEIRNRFGPLRFAFALLAPLVRSLLKRRMPYRGVPGSYADPWRLFEERWPGAALD